MSTDRSPSRSSRRSGSSPPVARAAWDERWTTSPVRPASPEDAECPRGGSAARSREVDPRYDEMLTLADALGVTPGKLVGYAEQL